MSAEETLASLASSGAHGLPRGEIAARLRRHGRNELPAEREEPWWKEVLESLTEPLVLLLIAVGVLYAIFGKLEDAITIFVVIVIVAMIETVNELRARHAVAALSHLGAPEATVVRSGEPVVVPAAELVPGDIALLAAGHRVPADVRLVAAHSLRVDESSLTGESVPAEKRADTVLPPATTLGDRRNMAFMGTLVTGGEARAVVVATAGETELGRVATLTRATPEARTPLQRQMSQLAGWLLWLAIGFSVVIPLLSIFVAHRPWRDALLEGLTLAFATIPEELPILITVVLGLGAYRLAREHAITKRLQAAETLGSVSVIGTDKTGTLTENRMELVELYANGARSSVADMRTSSALREVLVVGMTATGARVITGDDGHPHFIGDPTDTAFLDAAARAGLLAEQRNLRVVELFPFDDVRKRIGAVYDRGSQRWVGVKGAPETVLAVCSSVRRGDSDSPIDEANRDALRSAADTMAADGERVIAIAIRRVEAGAKPAVVEAEHNLTFVALAGLLDPPRPEAASAVRALHGAGVRVVMLTGDHPATAHAIAGRVGVAAAHVATGKDVERAGKVELRDMVKNTSVFARITPEEKLRLVGAFDASGAVVGIIGDGVNDAPALAHAPIGIAMGRRGTDVAREAADLVLSDDNFATVVTAVHTGRALYENLWKAVRFYLAAKFALITASLVVALAQLPLPFAPVQIIVLELFMDLGASTTFVAEPPEGDVMARPPRDARARFMDRAMIGGILGGGLSLALAVLVAYGWATMRGLGPTSARSAAFVAWMVGHLVLAAHMRSRRAPLFGRAGARLTWPFTFWVVSALGLLVAGYLLPFLGRRLYLTPLSPDVWVVTLAAAVVLPSWWEAAKRMSARA